MEGELQRTVGRNLRSYRQARGINQEDFADLLGLHRTYMGAIERGERNLSLRKVERLAARLRIEPLALLESPADRDLGQPPRTGEGQIPR